MAAPTLEGTTALISDRYICTFEADTGGVTAGQVVYLSAAWKVKPTDGARKDVVGVALTTAAAGKKVAVVCRGLVRVVASAAITVNSRIGSAAAGKVAAIAALDAPASYAEAAMQTELDKIEQWIGRALDAASADGDVIRAVVYCIP